MKKRRTKLNKKKRYSYIALIILVFMFSLFLINDNRKLIFFERITKDAVLFINQTLSYPFKAFNNDKKEIEQIELYVKKSNQSEIDNLKKQLEELKQSLDLKSISSDYDYINATVINRNLGFWYNTVTINKGIKDGIKKDMAVISSEGLIGKIAKTTRYNSTVKLLTSDDDNNQVSVQIKQDDKYLYGILTSFNQKSYEYIIEGITETTEIKKGALVSTTGMGDIFPSGILIGEVIDITKDNFDLESIVKVKPSININNFNYVKVLRRNQ